MSTLELIKQLRERTGLGMMDCKKALVEAGNDLEAAIKLLREKSGLKAVKRSGKVAAEGRIVVKRSADKKLAFMVEVNSETDFVAGDENFIAFSDKVTQLALDNNITDVEALSTAEYEAGVTVEQARTALVGKVGENLRVRRLAELSASGLVGAYQHGSKIGVLVALDKADDQLAEDIAMHIAATSPQAVSPEDVSADTVEAEKAIFVTQAENSGKPAEIVEKMVQGRIKKFLQEISLLSQPFVKNPDQTIEQLLKEHGAKVLGFVRFEVGEGIEKEQSDFASEVMAQVRGE